MAFVDVGLALGASEAFAGVVGTAAVGAGAGAAYSAITGDGNVLNSALTGATIGATLGSFAPAGGFSAASAPSTLAAPTSNVLTQVPAATTSILPAEGGNVLVNSSNQLLNSSGAVLNPSAAANIPGAVAPAADLTSQVYSGASAFGGTGGASVPVTGYDALSTLGPAKEVAAGLTGGQKLAVGLAGTAALSLLGGQNQKKISPSGTQNPAMVRPYTYAQTKNPNFGQPGEPYYIQGYTAQTPYKAAAGGLMGQNGSFISQDEQSMYPQSQMDKTQYAVSSQMPTSAEVVGSDYDAKTNAYTGLPMARFDAGGHVGVPNVPTVEAPLATAINPQTNQNEIIAPVQLPTVAYTPQAVADPNQFLNTFTQLQNQPAPIQTPSADVVSYQQKLNERANDEYVKRPTPAAFRAAPQPSTYDIGMGGGYLNDGPGGPGKSFPDIIDPGFGVDGGGNNFQVMPQPVTADQGIQGLYRYYLGRDATEAELPQWKYGQTITPADAADFRQYIGGELGRTGYKSIGPDPFTGQDGGNINMPLNGTIGLANLPSAGLPQYTYNPITKTFGKSTTPPYVFHQNVVAPLPSYQQDQYGIEGSGGAAGGLMPSALKYASGGATGYNLGGYSDGGRLLKGPGDGMSDNIPASIGNRQPARLADGEFVVPADVVSHLGNGSTDAGAKKLYAMMDKVREARVGTKKQGKKIKADKYLPT